MRALVHHSYAGISSTTAAGRTEGVEPSEPPTPKTEQWTRRHYLAQSSSEAFGEGFECGFPNGEPLLNRIRTCRALSTRSLPETLTNRDLLDEPASVGTGAKT